MFKQLGASLVTAVVLAVSGAVASAQEIVTRENFVRAETDRMFRDIAMLAGGVNAFHHVRSPTPLDQQTVIRMNRDTLYSGAIIDTEGGATITVPAMPDGRYASVLIIDNDHYAPTVFYEPGVHELPPDTRHMFAAVRIQVYNPDDPAEIALINGLQDKFTIQATHSEPLPAFDWDSASLDSLRTELDVGSQAFPNWEGAMGPRGTVDANMHLYATAAAWGLFPEQHATYLIYNGGHGSDQCFTATYTVPKTDAFWSITVYGATGFIESEANLVNSSNVTLNADGTFTVYFGSKDLCGDVPNRVDVTEGWNYMMRIYRPDASVLGGGYTLPAAVPVQ